MLLKLLDMTQSSVGWRLHKHGLCSLQWRRQELPAVQLHPHWRMDLFMPEVEGYGTSHFLAVLILGKAVCCQHCKEPATACMISMSCHAPQNAAVAAAQQLPSCVSMSLPLILWTGRWVEAGAGGTRVCMWRRGTAISASLSWRFCWTSITSLTQKTTWRPCCKGSLGGHRRFALSQWKISHCDQLASCESHPVRSGHDVGSTCCVSAGNTERLEASDGAEMNMPCCILCRCPYRSPSPAERASLPGLQLPRRTASPWNRSINRLRQLTCRSRQQTPSGLKRALSGILTGRSLPGAGLVARFYGLQPTGTIH